MEPQQYTLGQIQLMTPEQYAKYRTEILAQYMPQMEEEAAAARDLVQRFGRLTDRSGNIIDLVAGSDPLLACYGCGLQCESTEQREEHEETCAMM